MGLRIKKRDMVMVITGRHKGKKGRVLSVDPVKKRIIIEGINMIKKHMKPNKNYTQGGIIDKEAAIDISNSMLVCPKCGKPTKINNVVIDSSKKTRQCKKCKEVIE